MRAHQNRSASPFAQIEMHKRILTTTAAAKRVALDTDPLDRLITEAKAALDACHAELRRLEELTHPKLPTVGNFDQ